ncbi:synaptotagmin-like protein 2 isoform X11 [Salmo salar]|uniref:Synaptotagmin-like protein 2 n=1 Tax=Salmo salar TaxID=8030 RepID=A0A1S3RNN8_SALSA|nr:synaptotagmin-like protein 2 isoform X11 [Salmo salar]|eukprot:XP_014053432.1 PREDICTED: synaptotagmin-like protein 2 isoform X8 [Salmo salar]
MIDLSYLTEEEQEMILSVLKRDTDLKRAEEQRVKNLQKQECDKGKLKYLTGEWFYETKSRRHRDRIHGSDIIKASISRRKPVTILELSQMWGERPSFVNSENQDVYVPPELSGLLEEPPAQHNNYYRDDSYNLQSPTKQRQNPFNSTPLTPETLEETDSQLPNEAMEQTKTPDGGHGENSSPIRLELKQMSSRPLSRSLEDVLSPPKREERSIIDQRREMNLNVDDVPPSSLLPLRLPPPSPSSLSVPEQMKNMSKSVSVLQDEKDGRDSDSTSVKSLNFSWKKRMGSSLTNLSLSSGMASMSSVSGSVASIYSGVDGDVEVKGTIRFAMNYVQKLGEFHIFIVHCRDLAVAEPKKNRSDPYVKCYLLPDKAKMGKRKTSVKKKTLNPTYNEILRFKVTMETLKTQALNVSVWHNDNFGRNSFLGEVDLDLSEWDFSNTQMNDYALKARISTQSLSPSHSQSIDHRGEMRIGLRFLPQISYSKRSSKTETGEVQIWVKDCKNLPAIRGAIIDPFVKCTVLPDTSRKSRQKTRVVKKTANPMFNHTMVYDGFRPDDLREACVEVTVWDHDRLTNHFIGGLRLGLGTGKSYGLEVDWMDSTSEEASLWERMMHSHNEWVEDVIPLRMLIMARDLSK